MTRRSLLHDDDPIRRVDRRSAAGPQEGEVMVTDDHDVIREWATRHGAEPATGEATRSGPATVNVQDGGVGIRFNFPAASQFRPIGWEEWLQYFTRYDLMFVYEADVPGQPPSARYRLVPRQKVQEQEMLR